MARRARVVIPGAPHHVTQRGNNRQDVFFTDDDRLAYLAFLRQQCARHGVIILCYCLMTNHVHLLLIPPDAASLALALGRAHWLYSQWVNRLHGRSGHLWQNRFYSCAVDPEGPHLWQAARYVECNPLRAGMCQAVEEYRWSSAACHCGRSTALAAEAGLAALPDPAAWVQLSAGLSGLDAAGWRAVLGHPADEAETRALRHSTHTGRPLAGDSWLSKVEAALGRRLRPLPAGRPRKTMKAE